MTFDEWIELLPKIGTSGDQVYDILRDWGREREKIHSWILPLNTENNYAQNYLYDRVSKLIGKAKAWPAPDRKEE